MDRHFPVDRVKRKDHLRTAEVPQLLIPAGKLLLLSITSFGFLDSYFEGECFWIWFESAFFVYFNHV